MIKKPIDIAYEFHKTRAILQQNVLKLTQCHTWAQNPGFYDINL